MDFTHLSEDEKINGIKMTSVPQYIREKAYLTDFSETLAQLAEMIIQLGVNLSLDPDEALEWARKLQQSISQSEFDSWVATLLDGGPSLFFETKAALVATHPNGAPGVALVRETDPAKIYVWNGSAWEDFGDYQGIEIKDESISTNKLADEVVTSRKLARNSVTHDKADFIISGEPSKNLFDKSKAVIGYRLDSTDGVTPVPSSAYAYVQNIPVKKNSDLFRNSAGGIFVFDENGNSVVRMGNGTTDATFNSGEGTLVSFNMPLSDIDNIMLEYGKVGTSYEEYREPSKELDTSIKINFESLELEQLQDIYTAGSGISIENGVISNTQDNSETSNKYYQVVGEDSFRIFQKLGRKDFVGYLYGAYGGENYMRMLDIAIFEIKEGAETSERYDLISGAMDSTSTDHHYTTTVGTKIGLTFRGTSLTLNHLTRIDGGLWKVTLDGVEYPSISTWNETQVFKSTKIADGLTNSQHNIVLEFVGSDPNNPPKHLSTGADTTARGWIYYPNTFVFTETSGGAYHFEEKGLIATKTSNKDFAITVEPIDISGEAQFFPLHSGNDTTNVVSKHLTIDGEDIDLTVPTDILPFENGAFSENLESKMTYETETRAEGYILWKFEENQINQEFELTFLKPTTLRNGYVFMLPVPYDILDKVKTNKREVTSRDGEAMGTATYFDNVATDTFRMLYSGEYKDFYLEAGMTNHSHGLSRLWLQRRDTSLFKLYPQPFLNTEVLVGDKIFFDGYFRVGKIKGINI